MMKHYNLYIDRIETSHFDCFDESYIEVLIDTIVKGLAAYAEREGFSFVDFEALKKELIETGQAEFGCYRARITKFPED